MGTDDEWFLDPNTQTRDRQIRITGIDTNSRPVTYSEQATFVDHNPRQDLAVLQISGSNYRPMQLGHSTEASEMTKTYAIGFGTRDQPAPFEGKVTLSSDTKNNGWMRLDMNLTAGDSGGPVFNDAGHVVGIVVAGLANAKGIVFAVPIDRATSLVNDAGGASPCKGQEASTNDAEDHVSRGHNYYKSKDYDHAILEYTKAIKLNPDEAEYYHKRALAYSKKGEPDLAIADYNSAIKLKSNDWRFYYNRGIAFDNKEEYDNAITDYTKAIELERNRAICYNNRGWSYFQKKQYGQAISDFTRAIGLQPDWARPYSNRGRAYYGLDQYDQAIDSYTKAIEREYSRIL